MLLVSENCTLRFQAFDAVEYRLDPRCTVSIVIRHPGYYAFVALFLLHVVPLAGETITATTARCVYYVTMLHACQWFISSEYCIVKMYRNMTSLFICRTEVGRFSPFLLFCCSFVP